MKETTKIELNRVTRMHGAQEVTILTCTSLTGYFSLSPKGKVMILNLLLCYFVKQFLAGTTRDDLQIAQ